MGQIEAIRIQHFWRSFAYRRAMIRSIGYDMQEEDNRRTSFMMLCDDVWDDQPWFDQQVLNFNKCASRLGLPQLQDTVYLECLSD